MDQIIREILVPNAPRIEDHHHEQLNAFLQQAKAYDPIPTAVVHPADANSLLGAVEAAEEGLIIPFFVGPEAKIRSVALECGVDLSKYTIVPTAHSHESAELSAQMAKEGKVHALMKGSLGSSELLAALIDKKAGLRTEYRLSHVFVMDVPSYHKTLIVTDAAINITPDLMTKRDIVQNAINCAHALGIEKPKVAILAAVEKVKPGMQSTIDAAALCKMADRKQITGALLDGPLAFDNAISAEAARDKGIDSEVSGDVDILLVPDLEAGNILAKQLQYLAGAKSAGIVLGAKVPVILTSRAAKPLERLSSCAVASLVARKMGLTL
ncbi:phosphate acetyltransferase [Oceanospirillum multiglobuliferum]|uniref:Phosphate acetyltransferase n=1 Tax=Oceanospirillum multiglobuliferum TaxID=64969 RepID=A0A1T4Q1T1_9GAMM|nr:bifunctional enoyl-CoA hydratase/phosphate acetyltransferase [Oceanospirillum multiglobuliferum]OPX55467.1 phosphate acetyltransferase [Oceanospirillum multiglobuliferum]SJZ97461.1 phosphate acetyltransferase [Oceanospirillum multiglobuliferum]